MTWEHIALLVLALVIVAMVWRSRSRVMPATQAPAPTLAIPPPGGTPPITMTQDALSKLAGSSSEFRGLASGARGGVALPSFVGLRF